MNKTIISGIIVAISTVGAGAIGYFAGYKTAEKKYKSLADEEVASVKEALLSHYGVKKEEPAPEKTAPSQIMSKSSIDGYSERNNEKVNYSKVVSGTGYSTKKEEEENEYSHIYVIRPEEFQDSDYDTVTLMYYADGILADDDYNVISDILGTVGPKALDSFGEYEDDSVYVRNDMLKIDYEILMDLREYSDIAPRAKRMSPEE